jgi:butyrate kinase
MENILDNCIILGINPGSTSTKIALWKGRNTVFSGSVSHSSEELSVFDSVKDQLNYRMQAMEKLLSPFESYLKKMCIVMGRGGLLPPVPSGIFPMNALLSDYLANNKTGEHASNLGGLLADLMVRQYPQAVAYICDPVGVDEFDELARISGHPAFIRKSFYHPLNHKAVARRHAGIVGKQYEDLNLIIAHMGGGITVGAHRKGRVVDVNNGLDGDGPFTPERAGTIPAGDLAKLCFSGQYTHKEIKRMLTGQGGLLAYLGTIDAREVEKRIAAGDESAEVIYKAMAYQVSKEIGAMFTVLSGDVDGILLTGGLAFSELFVGYIRERIGRLGQIFLYPGEDEMGALLTNSQLILEGKANIIHFDHSFLT